MSGELVGGQVDAVVEPVFDELVDAAGDEQCRTSQRVGVVIAG
ncbi:hypothetical protein ACWDUL_02755 [Nocardia niigatensis]